MKRKAVVCVALLVASGTAVAQEGLAQRGRVFAQTHCASCHAIGRVGASPLKIAPAFRTLHQRYAAEDLSEAFAEGIVTGHPTMPEFRLDAVQVADLIAYLPTLK